MRKILNLALVAMLALGVASCSKESTIDGGDVNGGGAGSKLAFNFEGLNSSVTPYSTVTAENFEKAVSDATVYIFEYSATQDGELLLVQNEDFSSTNNYLMIIEDVDDLVNKQLVAYFVLNNGSSFDTYADLTAYTATSAKTEADFIEETTDVITGAAARLDFLMTGAINGGDHFPHFGEYPVEVKRRVARFDIINENPASVTAITKVTVRNATESTYVFGDATGLVTDINPIAVNVVYDLTAAEYGDDAQTALAWVAGTNDKGLAIRTASSVFYLNPTQFLQDNSASQIFIEATVGTATKVFELELSKDIDVLANHRYILTLTTDLRFRITVADWDINGDETITTQPINTKVRLVADPTLTPASVGVFNATYNSIAVADPTAAFSAGFAFGASSVSGVSVEVIATTATGLIEVGSDIIDVTAPTTETTVTYGKPYFKSTFTASFEAGKIEADKNFTTILRVTDIATKESMDIILYYAESTTTITGDDGEEVVMYDTGAGKLPAVKVGSIYWAPVNVGATTITGTREFSDVGYFFQWGRNTGFIANSGYPVKVLDSSITIAEAEALEGTFLAVTRDFFNDYTTHAWTSEDLGGWNSGVGPCPNGWRLPTRNDAYATEIYDTFIPENHYFPAKNAMVIPVGGQELVFPTGVVISPVDAVITPNPEFKDIARIWTSTQPGSRGKSATSLQFTDKGVLMNNTGHLSHGFNVRCVKE